MLKKIMGAALAAGIVCSEGYTSQNYLQPIQQALANVSPGSPQMEAAITRTDEVLGTVIAEASESDTVKLATKFSMLAKIIQEYADALHNPQYPRPLIANPVFIAFQMRRIISDFGDQVKKFEVDSPEFNKIKQEYRGALGLPVDQETLQDPQGYIPGRIPLFPRSTEPAFKFPPMQAADGPTYHQRLATLTTEVAECKGEIAQLHQTVAEQVGVIASLWQKLQDLEQKIPSKE
ncbi:MAG: hypothetical protein LBJ92_03175 [Holosporales bacterium]|jgi:uncharacterized coiled-coil protein SlyX|nr:hypothetical protein [Holosporales bacterium]